MGLLDNFKSWVIGAEEDDYEYETEEEMREQRVQETSSYVPPRTHTAQTSTAVRESVGGAVSTTSRNDRVLNISATTKMAVVLVKAEQFNSVVDIADHLKNKMTVVLNLENTEKEVATRMLDFLSGVAFAIEGKIKRVAKDIYLITPYNVEIVGEDLISELESNGLRFRN